MVTIHIVITRVLITITTTILVIVICIIIRMAISIHLHFPLNKLNNSLGLTPGNTHLQIIRQQNRNAQSLSQHSRQILILTHVLILAYINHTSMLALFIYMKYGVHIGFSLIFVMTR